MLSLGGVLSLCTSGMELVLVDCSVDGISRVSMGRVTVLLPGVHPTGAFLGQRRYGTWPTTLWKAGNVAERLATV